MDLIELNYHDSAALNAGQVPGIGSLSNGWEHDVLTYYHNHMKLNSTKDIDLIHMKNTISFTLGDDHIELYDGIFVKTPFTDLKYNITGSFKTCNLNMFIEVKGARIKGKMCIRNANKDPIDTEFELLLKHAEIEMTVGIEICGYGIDYNYIIYKLNDIDLSFMYRTNSGMSQFLNKIEDDDQKKLLTAYLSEYCVQELYPAIEYYQLSISLSKYHLQQHFDESPINRNIISIHSRMVITAFNNLAGEIIDLTNSSLEEESPKIVLNFLGISEDANNKKIIKNFEGSIYDLGSIAMIKDINVIVSQEDSGIVFVHVPVKVHKFSICYKEKTDDKSCTTNTELKNSMQSHTIDNAYFYLSLNKLSKDKVSFELKGFKIQNIRPLSEYQDKLTIDFLIMHKIEESIKEFLNRALDSKNLQEMAINPDFDFDYHASDFYVRDYESSDICTSEEEEEEE